MALQLRSLWKLCTQEHERFHHRKYLKVRLRNVKESNKVNDKFIRLID